MDRRQRGDGTREWSGGATKNVATLEDGKGKRNGFCPWRLQKEPTLPALGFWLHKTYFGLLTSGTVGE